MFPCDWCGTPIDHYAAHFADPRFSGCREAALRPAPKLEILDGGNAHVRDTSPQAQAERNKIRGRTRRDLYRSRNRDRTERIGLATQLRR